MQVWAAFPTAFLFCIVAHFAERFLMLLILHSVFTLMLVSLPFVRVLLPVRKAFCTFSVPDTFIISCNFYAVMVVTAIKTMFCEKH